MTRKEFIDKNLRPKERKRFYAMLKVYAEKRFSKKDRSELFIEEYLSKSYNTCQSCISKDIEYFCNERITHKKWNDTYLTRLVSALEEKTKPYR